MGKIHSGENWLIRVQGNEHPPVHVHVICPEGKAAVYLDGQIINCNVPASTLKHAQEWIMEHHDLIHEAWAWMNNPVKKVKP
ncbi:MAG: DUF4160 domain-containing protein [Zoogloeaceae bacterium]|jgi:hypothetical protein|nr:DUF4160 domain-containing protein [Zoogloeaceae bacterium]